jgi:aminobenzoyl-glutamate transport protein
MTATTPAPAPAQKRGVVQRMLDGVERLGNKVPHPAMIFLGLCALVIVLSAVLSALDVGVTYESVSPPPQQVEQTYQGGSVVPAIELPPEPVATEDYAVRQETVQVESLLSIDGLRFLFTSAVANFNDFNVIGVILIAMVGVGVAEESGLIGALIRRLVKVAPAWSITFIIVLVGMISSIASDAGYLVLIPLGAVVFRSLGRNPVAGIAAAFAGVGAR